MDIFLCHAVKQRASGGGGGGGSGGVVMDFERFFNVVLK